MLGTGLLVSMYTTKTPIDMCCFNVRSSTLKKNLNIFCKRQISIKLFYLYQGLQCRDNYFFKIKFVFFLYLMLSASWKENDLPLYISDFRQIVGYRTPVFIQPFPWRLHITITTAATTMICWRCHSNSVNTGSRLPNISDVKTRKRRSMVGIDMIRNRIESA